MINLFLGVLGIGLATSGGVGLIGAAQAHANNSLIPDDTLSGLNDNLIYGGAALNCGLLLGGLYLLQKSV